MGAGRALGGRKTKFPFWHLFKGCQPDEEKGRMVIGGKGKKRKGKVNAEEGSIKKKAGSSKLLGTLTGKGKSETKK